MAVALFYGCPNGPDFCPGIMADMATARRRLPEDLVDDISLIVVTTDPARDTPEVLKTYLSRVDDSFIGSLCPSLFAGTACARECEIRGHCSLMRAQDEDRKVQDVTLNGPDGAAMAPRMWATRLPPNRGPSGSPPRQSE